MPSLNVALDEQRVYEKMKAKGEEWSIAYATACDREIDLLKANWTPTESPFFIRCASCCRSVHSDSMVLHKFGPDIDLICVSCNLKEKPAYWMDTKWKSSTTLPPVNGNSWSKNNSKPLTTTTPTPSRKISVMEDVRTTFAYRPCPKPSGHLDVVNLSKLLMLDNIGNLLLSSSRDPQAHASSLADAAIFFDSGWKTKWKGVPGVPERTVRVGEVLTEGNNGLEWPEVVEVIPAKPSSTGDVTKGPVIYVPWTDGQPPDLDIITPFVEETVKFIKEGKTVQVGCIGGHGRTGTFAAMVLLGLRKMPATSAINLLRMAYCSKSVENYRQEDSVFIAAGEEVPPTPTTFRSTFQGGYYGGAF